MTPREELDALRRLAELEAKMGGASPRPASRDVGALNALGQGMNTRIAGILGTPVDLATAALGYAGHKAGLLREPLDLERSLGGSASFRRGFANLGMPTYADIRELPPEARKYAVGGETFAGAALPGMAGAGLVRATAGAMPRVIDPATRMAMEAPRRFLAAEGGMALGSGAGAATAEAAFPGNPLARLVGEVGGSFGPIGLLARMGGPAVERVGQAAAQFTEGGREAAAARVIQNMAKATGESPQAMINALRRQDPLNLNLTAGQSTASPTLLGLETRLANASPQFKAEAARRATEAFDTLGRAGTQMAGAAPIAPLTSAAQARVGQTQGLAQARARAAEQLAEQSRGQVGRVDERGMSVASVAAREALDQSMTSARTQEHKLWEQIPRDVPIEPAGVIAARERIRAELLPNENLPQPVETFTGNLARGTGRNVEVSTMTPEGIPMIGTEQTQAVTSSGDLLRLRNRALTAAREARGGANPDYSLARQMDAIADGALDDLSRMNVPGVEQAREFSRNLNQAMTQGEPGRIMQRAARGGQQVPAELTLERSFRGSGFTNTGGGTPGATAFRELQQGAAFGGQGQTMQNAQETFLRGAAQATLGADGRVRPDALNTFLRRNQEVLDQFPQLRNQLSSAESAERIFLQVSGITEKAQRNAAKTLFGQIAGEGNPVAVMRKAIDGDNATQAIESLARSAQRAGPDAMGGLRSATLEALFKKASRGDGVVDFGRLNQSLNVPGTYQQGAESVMQTMRRTGVLDQAGADRLQMIIDRSNLLTRATGTRSDFDKLMDNPDALSDFVMRTVGANIGAAAGGGGGATLVAASAGSKALRNLMAKLPAAKAQAVLIEAAKNPALMAKLLERPTSVNKARELMRQINGYMMNAGIEFAYGADDETRPLQRSIDTIAQ